MAALLIPGFAAAQTAPQSQPAPTPPPQVSEKDALKSFDVNERTAIDAIKNDANLTPIQKKQQIADLKKDDKTKRKALEQKYADKQEALHDEIRTQAAEDRRARADHSARR
jgi:hypothetical protein